MPQLSISDLLTNYTARFLKAGVDSPRLCAELILAEILGASRAQLIAFSERLVCTKNILQCEALAQRREQAEPLAYILGRKEFYGLEFMVTPAVLIPRPETELLVELAKQHLTVYCPSKGLSPSSTLRFADLGTGSGCILISILMDCPACLGLGVDISAAALNVAQKNIHAHQLQNRSLLIQADMANLPLQLQSLHLIVSNPPYISTSQYQGLNLEVRGFEPELALHSGIDGLDHPGKVIKAAERYLEPGGLLLMEIGDDQGEATLALLACKQAHTQWKNPKIIKDLAGRDRVAAAYKT